jgi:cation:H+ antiporter
MWWMIGTSLLLLPLMRSDARLTRVEGSLLLGAYVAYVVVLLRS